jgi:polyisoprenyl-teichoic acid--peptidoglycan teichoic acid transferase
VSRHRPSSFGAAFRSTIVPGWGQLVTDRVVVGKILVFLTGLIAIAGLTVFLFVEPIEIAAWLANPDVLFWVVLANLAFAAVRIFSTGHAWAAGGGRRLLVVVLLGIFVAIPHAAIAWVGLETRDSMMKVFPTTAAVTPASSTTAVQPTTTTMPATTSTQLELTPDVTAPGEYGDDEIDLEEIPVWRPFGVERLNILLLGGDAGPRRSGLRTDTMIVASIDPVNGDTALIGIPRNFGAVTLKDGTEVPVEILNAVYGWGNRHPDLFDGPDPGASATVDVLENITGLGIDYYLLVDLTGFAELVDAVGGVHIDVPKAVDGPLYDPVTGAYEMVRIEAGEQFLDGGHALAYARVRHDSTDYVRMGRQRCLLTSMARDIDPVGLLPRLGDLLEAIEVYVTTDLPMDLVPDLIRLGPRVSSDEIRVVGFDHNWKVGRTPDGAAIPDIVRIREAVKKTLENPDAAPDLGVTTAGAACA